MENIKLDKNYDLLEEKKGLYDDDFVDSIDLIKRAESNRLISSQEALLLLNFILRREFKNEVRSILPFRKHKIETHSMFMNLRSKQVKHA